MSFANILGHERALRRLKALLKNRRIPPALLFAGPEGVGKAEAAFAFAQGLNCTKNKVEACGKCPSCSASLKNIDPDLHRVNPEYQANLLGEDVAKQKIIKVDTIRHLIRDLEMRSLDGRWKIAILENAHRLAPAAANAMLKSLEEPPPLTLWILVTHQPSQLLATIRSRCQTLTFTALSAQAIIRLLTTSGVAYDQAENAARLAEGSVSRARMILEDALPDPASWIKDPMAPIRMAESLPRELHLARPLTGDHIRNMAWFIRRSQGIRGYALAPVRTVLREYADMHRALAANADPRLILQLSAMRLQQLDAVLRPEASQ